MAEGEMNDQALGGLILILIAAFCYFLPFVIALVRGKASGTAGVLFVNICLGWTILGWFVAFIWACSGETNAEIAKRDRQHRELLAIVTAKK
jgi:threonine/homoserine/homoserine lactone efflux protein